jgi:RNA polymerase sigma-70 factor (ECF subfamily)
MERSRLDPDELFARAQAGDQLAWEELVRRCWPKVLRVVRRRLNTPMRSLYDSTDFANDVFKSLIADSGRLEFASFGALEAHLARVARDKVIDEYRRQYRDKRDLARNRPLETDEEHSGVGELPAHQPTPSQFAQAREAHDRILSGRTPEDRAVIELKLQDYTNEEAASETGLHVRKVQRLLKRVYDSFWATSGGR